MKFSDLDLLRAMGLAVGDKLQVGGEELEIISKREHICNEGVCGFVTKVYVGDIPLKDLVGVEYEEI